jgi:hypothetical protein
MTCARSAVLAEISVPVLVPGSLPATACGETLMYQGISA